MKPIATHRVDELMERLQKALAGANDEDNITFTFRKRDVMASGFQQKLREIIEDGQAPVALSVSVNTVPILKNRSG